MNPDLRYVRKREGAGEKNSRENTPYPIRVWLGALLQTYYVVEARIYAPLSSETAEIARGGGGGSVR